MTRKTYCGNLLWQSGLTLLPPIAIDGVSLTISGLGDDWLAVDVIPSTASETTIGQKKPGDKVNLESDVIGKYAAKMVSAAKPGLTEEALARAGFM